MKDIETESVRYEIEIERDNKKWKKDINRDYI